MIVLVGRSETKCQPTIDQIKAVDSSIKVKFFQVELSSIKSVRAAAHAILDDSDIPAIDVMINNAAIMAAPFQLSVDGIEMQLATNYLSHFLLTNILLPKVLAAGPGARIVNVSSVGNNFSGIRFSDPNFTEEGSYAPFKGYGQSKTGNILFAVALNKRLASKGLRAYALNPGSIQTNLGVHMTPELAEYAMQTIFGRSFDETSASEYKTLQQGCSTQLRAALDANLEKEPGVFLNNCALSTDPVYLAPYATNAEDAERLWKLSEELVGEKFGY
jgi:NAD(P)-dependent dehydrogenase (short-subunit alcohol dehydrogenase family)